MEPITLTLYGKVPSKKNSKRRIQRGASVFMVPSKAHEDWHAIQMWELRSWKHSMVHPKLVRLEYYAADKRPNDLSNKTESVMDLLVDAGIIEDDNWFVVGEINMRLVDIDRKNPRVVLHFS